MTSDKKEAFSPDGSNYGYYQLKQDAKIDKSVSETTSEAQKENLLVSFSKQNEKMEVYRLSLVVTASVFMGYAALVTMQHKLKDQIQANYDAAGRDWTDEVEAVFDH